MQIINENTDSKKSKIYFIYVNNNCSVKAIPPRAEGLLTEKWQRRKVGKAPKTCNSIWMQFLNDIIKSRHGSKIS